LRHQRHQRTFDLNQLLKKRLGPTFSTRSIRLTVLQAMGNSGIEIQEIRHVSAHTSDRTTRGYLEGGLLDRATVNSVARIAASFNTPNQPPTPTTTSGSDSDSETQ